MDTRLDPRSLDLHDRAAWAAERRRLEARKVSSTPWGERRAVGGGALEAVLATARFALRASGLERAFVRHALGLERVEMTLSWPDLPRDLDGYRIAHVTDPHFDGLHGLADRVAGLLRGREADLLALTGDYRLRSRGAFVERGVMGDMARVIEAAAARDGAVAVLGNHDTHDMPEALEAAGATVLVNERLEIRRGSARLVVTGTDDPNHCYTPRASAALEAFRPGPDAFGLALVHSPELAHVAARAGHRLYLCGHVHGGQVAWRGRPLISHLHGNKHLAVGLWRHEGLTGYTSRGAGCSALPLRLGCPGEVTILTLARSS